MRSMRAFWSWLASKEIIDIDLFSELKIPKPPKKIMTTSSKSQIQSLLGVMNGSAEGYRDIVIVLTLLGTGLRVNEFTGISS